MMQEINGSKHVTENTTFEPLPGVRMMEVAPGQVNLIDCPSHQFDQNALGKI